MRSASGSERYKMVHYEISHGGYVIADDRLALPNYLVHVSSQDYFIVDIDMEEELNERGNGEDSGDDSYNAR